MGTDISTLKSRAKKYRDFYRLNLGIFSTEERLSLGWYQELGGEIIAQSATVRTEEDLSSVLFAVWTQGYHLTEESEEEKEGIE